jgi:hypothetical protein
MTAMKSEQLNAKQWLFYGMLETGCPDVVVTFAGHGEDMFITAMQWHDYTPDGEEDTPENEFGWDYQPFFDAVESTTSDYSEWREDDLRQRIKDAG